MQRNSVQFLPGTATIYVAESVTGDYLLSFLPSQVFHLIESIELIVRQYLNVDTFTASTDVCTSILEEVQQSESVLSHWETIASKVITALWISVRGYSFAKEWTIKFQQSKYQKGTRKTLNQCNK